MSKRIRPHMDRVASIENDAHDRCVWISSWAGTAATALKEFRRDVEDGGAWTPVAFYSHAVWDSSGRQPEYAAARAVAIAARTHCVASAQLVQANPGCTDR